MKEVISTKNAPAALGAYSQGIAFKDFVYTSGQTPIDPATGKLVEGDIKDQTRQCMKNIKAILEEAGLGMDNIIKATIFMTDINNFAAINEVYASFYPGAFPARSAIGVRALPAGAQVEIEAIAVR